MPQSPRAFEQGFFEPERTELQLQNTSDYFQHVAVLRKRINFYKGKAVHLNWQEQDILRNAEHALRPDGATQDALMNICAATLLSAQEYAAYQTFATQELSPPLDGEEPSAEHDIFTSINIKVTNAFFEMYNTGVVPKELNKPLPPELQTTLRNQLENVDLILRQL